VDWRRIEFGKVSGEVIEATVDLGIEFDDSGRIGGVVEKIFVVALKLERRWEL